MAVLGTQIRVTRKGDPPFLIDASINVDEACNISRLIQLGLPPGFMQVG